MSDDFTPSLGGSATPSRVPITGAGTIVGSKFASATTYADRAFTAAEAALRTLASSIEDLDELQVNQTNDRSKVNISNIGYLQAPTLRENDYKLTAPVFYGLRPIVNLGPIDGDILPLPDPLRSPPDLNFGNKPDVVTPQRPQDRPVLFDVEKYIPESPEYEFPQLPELTELDDILPPEIINHSFDASRPVNDLVVPETSQVALLATPKYQSELQSEIQVVLRRKLKGGTGLPPAIEQMIFARARDREDTNADRAIQEAVEEWATRGFSLPSGVLDKKLQAARQLNQAQNNAFSRELEIESYKREIENLQFAVTQGIALENINIQLFMSLVQWSLAQAQAIDQFVQGVFASRVELFNAEVGMFRVEAEVYRELVRAELSKVEMFRTQIEAERVKGELNQQKVAIYRTQLEALSTMVQIYSTQMEAANTISNVNANLIRVYEADINAYRAQIESNKAEFDAWGAEIQGELGKMQGYEAEARAFSARVSAYETSVNAASILPRLKLEEFATKAQMYRADIDRFNASLQAEVSRIQAKSTFHESQIAKYRAQLDKELGQLNVDIEEEKIKLQDRSNNVQETIENNRIRAQNADSLLQATVNALQSVAQVSSQLAGAAMSAVSASASVSESGSASNSWSFSDSTSESTSTSTSTSNNTNISL